MQVMNIEFSTEIKTMQYLTGLILLLTQFSPSLSICYDGISPTAPSIPFNVHSHVRQCPRACRLPFILCSWLKEELAARARMLTSVFAGGQASAS